MTDQVYFLASEGRIKVGYTRRVRERIASISSHLKEPGELIGHIKGGRQLEQAIHHKMSPYKIKGEWFRDCTETRQLIRNLILSGPSAIDFIPSPRYPLRSGPVESKSATAAEFFDFFPKIVAMMWPHDGLRELTAFTEYPEQECRDWLEGRVMPPRLVRTAFAALVIEFITNKHTEQMRSFKKPEIRQRDLTAPCPPRVRAALCGPPS